MALMTLAEVNEELEIINNQLKSKGYSITSTGGSRRLDNHDFSELIKRKDKLLQMRQELTGKSGNGVANVKFS